MFTARVKASAFTLVELLVVIAVVAILSALLLPAAQGVRARGQAIKCLSNMRQTGLAIFLYGDERRTFPHGCDAVNNTDWTYLINSYVGVAPAADWSDPNARSRVLVCPAGRTYGSNICSGYSAHERLFGNTYNLMPGFGAPREYPSDERTHEVVMLVDGSQNFVDAWGQGNANSLYNFPASMGTQADYDPSTADDPVTDVGTDIDEQMSQMRFRHAGKVNVLFLDGHAASMGKTDFYRRNFSISP